ncbi:MAG: class I SAM-dependent methyltransferase [Planctomycetota bacterium]
MQNELINSLVQRYRGYGLESFRHILEALLGHAGSLEAFKDKRFLELGPGTRIGLLRFLKEEAGAEHVQGLGKMMIWPWTGHRAFVRAHVENAYLLDALRPIPSASYDAVYSRRVMEQHSIDPWILISSRRFWGRFKGHGFRKLDQDYPSSQANIQAVFKEAYRILKPGGIMVSEIGRRRFSCLDPGFLERFHPKESMEKPFGKMSSLITVVKGE